MPAGEESTKGSLGCQAVRGMELRRRRSSRVPWIYLVYHVRECGASER
jgi:hypothetical protein